VHEIDLVRWMLRCACSPGRSGPASRASTTASGSRSTPGAG